VLCGQSACDIYIFFKFCKFYHRIPYHILIDAKWLSSTNMGSLDKSSYFLKFNLNIITLSQS
jgi:hypothetical protein